MEERKLQLLHLLGGIRSGEGALVPILSRLPDDSLVLRASYVDRDALVEALAWIRDEKKNAGPTGSGQQGAGAGAGAAAVLDVVDESVEWSQELVHVEPTEVLPQGTAEVERFLTQPLRKRLPVSATIYNMLAAHPLTLLLAKEHLIACSSAELLTSHINVALDSPTPGGNETANAALLVMSVFDVVVSKLARLSQALELHFSRNAEHYPSSTQASLRPDLCIWYRGTALLFQGAQRSPSCSSLADAVSDLFDNMSCPWNGLTMGSLPYLPCYASCGSELQFYIIKRGSRLAEPVSKVFNLQRVSERILFLRATVNIFRLLRLLAPHAPVNPLPVGKELTRPFGTTVTIKSASVVKRIKAFSLQPNITSSFDDLRQMYAATSHVPHLIHCVATPTLSDRDVYSAELQPLGYACSPTGEAELKKAIHSILSALSGLHAQGYAHRDLRWGNILCNAQGGWVLIDLESAARLDQPPGSFTCVDWTADTLTGGLYTAASDVQLVGRLMLPWDEQLSSSGRQLAEAMRHADASARPTAQAALSHSWFSKAAV